MKKLTSGFVAVVMVLAVECSGDKRKAPEDAKPQVKLTPPAGTPLVTRSQIVCDKFALVTKVTGSTLDLSVDTDLPDSPVVMVTVSRSYVEQGEHETHSVEYFGEKSTIGQWRSPRRISIAGDEWKAALRAKQDELSRVGLGFDVVSISEKIKVHMVVPINQPDPRFGDMNQNLSGKAVRTTGIRVVEDELEIGYPLDSPPTGKSPVPTLHPFQLEVGQSYVVSKDTPLIPSRSPTDPLAALQQMKQIPQGGGFAVLEVDKGRTIPWYRVEAFDQTAAGIGIGWVNSVALVGQELKANER